MFYLLENNRIICDEKIIKEIKKTFNGDLNVEIEKNELRFTYINDRGIKYIVLEPRKFKKQSENVYDLIEKGDLITEKRIWWNEEVYVIANVCSKEGKLIHCFHSTLFDDDVYAIYKPDAGGNYIKAWEKKDEKED